MSLHESLTNKIEAQIQVWQDQLDSLKNEAKEELAKAKKDQADAEMKEEFAQKMETIQNKIDDAKDKASEVKDASSDKLQQIKSDVQGWFH
ncbi:MAG: hypothetical protein ACMZ64_05210 [Oleiphilus sp.]